MWGGRGAAEGSQGIDELWSVKDGCSILGEKDPGRGRRGKGYGDEEPPGVGRVVGSFLDGTTLTGEGRYVPGP